MSIKYDYQPFSSTQKNDNSTESQEIKEDNESNPLKEGFEDNSTASNTSQLKQTVDKSFFLFRWMNGHIQKITEQIQNVMSKRSNYDPADYIASKLAAIIVGRKETATELKSFFIGTGVEINDIFTKEKLNELDIEPIKDKGEQYIHDLIYGYIMFLPFIWVIYNWYFLLFDPNTDCPEMNDYADYYKMLWPGIFTGGTALCFVEMEKLMYILRNLLPPSWKRSITEYTFLLTFLLVNSLWIKGAAKLDFDSLQGFIHFLIIVNIFLGLWVPYIADTIWPPSFMSCFFIILAYVLLLNIMITISSKFISIIYVVLMIYLTYISFFSLFSSKKSFDVFQIMDDINKQSIREVRPDSDSFTWFMNIINNMIFGAPVMLLLAMFTLHQMSDLGNHLNDIPAILQTPISIFLGFFFIFSMIMVLVKFIKNIMNKNPKNESIQVNPEPSAAIGSMLVKLAPTIILAIGAIGIMMCIVLFA